MDYSQIRASVQLTVGEHEFLLEKFENLLRQYLSSDISALITNSITAKTIQNSISSALSETADYALDCYERTSNIEFQQISHKLWSPIISKFCSMVVSVEALPSELVRPLKPSKPKQNMKPAFHPIPAGVDVKTIRKRLSSLSFDKRSPYQNTAHGHIVCKRSQCSFCAALFRQVNLTQCVGHKPCHATGFYPHVGTALWSMLKTKHNKGDQCKVKPKPPGQHELPALDVRVEPKRPPNLEVVAEEEEQDLNTSDLLGKRPYTPTSTLSDGPLDWAESVEEFYKKRRASSCPPKEAC